MKQLSNIRKLINIIYDFQEKNINFITASRKAKQILPGFGKISTDDFNSFFSIFCECFFYPTKKARKIMTEKKISKANLLSGYRSIKKSNLLKELFLSNWYPRALLVKAANNLLDFIQENQQYLLKIARREPTGPMMLEIHPTDATCIYKCQMCLWCGGNNQLNSIFDFYKSKKLLTADDWCLILEEARKLGTRQIIFSGGGETLLSQTKIKPVLDKANSLGFETMIYTNGRMLAEINAELFNSLLNSNWLRISLHAVTPKIYAELVNRPLSGNDLNFVTKGIEKIVRANKEQRRELKIGIGVVLQQLNYLELQNITKLCSDLNIDFLDVRVDCIGITQALSNDQYNQTLEDLRALREDSESGLLNFKVSFADDLLIKMDNWPKVELTRPKECLIPVIRPAIDPFGVVGACDSIGEPFIRSKSPKEYILGNINQNCSFSDIMRNTAGKKLGVNCPYCMPGQIALNALMEKIIDDFQIGIKPWDQPFCFS